MPTASDVILIIDKLTSIAVSWPGLIVIVAILLGIWLWRRGP